MINIYIYGEYISPEMCLIGKLGESLFILFFFVESHFYFNYKHFSPKFKKGFLERKKNFQIYYFEKYHLTDSNFRKIYLGLLLLL